VTSRGYVEGLPVPRYESDAVALFERYWASDRVRAIERVTASRPLDGGLDELRRRLDGAADGLRRSPTWSSSVPFQGWRRCSRRSASFSRRTR
jgi:hypothetical protein